jgi:hypothetical protein
LNRGRITAARWRALDEPRDWGLDVSDKLSASQIYTLLMQGGFSPRDATVMTAIAQAESAGNLGAVGDVRLQNGTWGPSVGLFQIRTLKAETGRGTDRDIEHLTGNPRAQVEAALNISDGGRNFRPWSTYSSGSYRQFLDNDLQPGAALDLSGGSSEAAGTAGTGGTGGTVADPFVIDRGTSPIKVVDRDGDGLTDHFEKLLGTDPTLSDTDQDGLSDTYESTSIHTDPLSKDTDQDGITDSVEQAQGTDPGQADLPDAARKAGFGGLDTLDSDRDGLSDGFETRHGLDPLSADSDGDLLPDGDEIARGSNPLSVDSNTDGLSDGFAAQHGLPTADPIDADLPH